MKKFFSFFFVFLVTGGFFASDVNAYWIDFENQTQSTDFNNDFFRINDWNLEDSNLSTGKALVAPDQGSPSILLSVVEETFPDSFYAEIHYKYSGPDFTSFQLNFSPSWYTASNVANLSEPLFAFSAGAFGDFPPQSIIVNQFSPPANFGLHDQNVTYKLKIFLEKNFCESSSKCSYKATYTVNNLSIVESDFVVQVNNNLPLGMRIVTGGNSSGLWRHEVNFIYADVIPPPELPPEGRTAVITSSQQPAPYPTHVFESTDTINFSFDYQVGSPVISGDVGVKITNLITGTTTRLAKAHTLLSTSFASSTTLEKGYYEYQPFIEVDLLGSIWGGGIQDVILGAPIPIYVEVDPALSPIFAPQTPDFDDISWECDFGWAGDSICQVVGYLFVPSGQSFQEFINLKDSLATVVPFGYFFQAIEIRKKIELPEGVYLSELPLRAELFSPVDVGMSVIIVILFGWWIINFLKDIK